MRTLALTVVVLAGCSTTRSNAPSAVDERNEAARDVRQSNAERAGYDPGQTRNAPPMARLLDGAPDVDFDTYNPTAGHLIAADREMREAAGHLNAARKIEAFEDVRCKDIPPAERAACPLLASAVARVAETSKGIALFFNPEIDAADTHRRLQCHLAYAEAEGFRRPTCPLFVKGMVLNMRRGRNDAIDLEGDNPSNVAEIKKQARRIFLGTMPVSSAPEGHGASVIAQGT